jgi:hypothetical protein
VTVWLSLDQEARFVTDSFGPTEISKLRGETTMIRKTIGIVCRFLTAFTLVFAFQHLAQASVFYKFDIVAQVGKAGLVDIKDNPSINDEGWVAFSGRLAGGESIFVGNGISMTNITPIISSRTFSRAVQINNANQVVGQDLVPGPSTRIRLWDANSLTFSIIARGGSGIFDDYDTVFSHPSVNNHGQVVFSALKGAQNVLATPASFFNEVPFSGLVRPMIADDGRIIVKLGSLADDPILLYENDMLTSFTTIADKTHFTTLGRSPGISDDGRIVTFYGELNAAGAAAFHTTPGPGIFASIDVGGGSRVLQRITGRQVEDVGAPGGDNNGICDPGETCIQAAELGYDEFGAPRLFASYDIDNRVAVTNLNLGAPGIDGDSFVLVFIATPNAASRDNPRIPGKPLFFSQEKGVWTIRVDVQRELSGALNRVFNVNGPIPVIQINDTVGGASVLSLALYDAIANAATDDAGVVRTQRRGDHRVALWAQTTAGNMIVRASQLDSDQDGLYDHWETKGGGIDIDQDGVIDLDLAAMGADPTHRDLFIEIDWLADQPGYKHEPAPGVLAPHPVTHQFPLMDMFTAAPALSSPSYGTRSDGGVPAGIPAGPGKDKTKRPFSVNMGVGPLQGGDRIGQPGNTSALIHVVYFGVDGSVVLPPGFVETRSMSDIKDHFFGTKDNRARELAFKYVVFGGFHSFIETAPGSGKPYTSSVAAATANTLTSATALPPGFTDGHGLLITSGPRFWRTTCHHECCRQYITR